MIDWNTGNFVVVVVVDDNIDIVNVATGNVIIRSVIYDFMFEQ